MAGSKRWRRPIYEQAGQDLDLRADYGRGGKLKRVHFE